MKRLKSTASTYWICIRDHRRRMIHFRNRLDEILEENSIAASDYLNFFIELKNLIFPINKKNHYQKTNLVWENSNLQSNFIFRNCSLNPLI